MVRRFSQVRYLYVRLIWSFALVIVLSGCALGLPGSSSSTTSGQHNTAMPVGTIKEFQANVFAGYATIVFDHTGNLWYAAPGDLGWRSQTGHLTQIDVASLSRSVFQLVLGSDDNLWFIGVPTRFGFGLPTSQTIGHVGIDGRIVEWEIPHSGVTRGIPSVSPIRNLVAGAGGNMWYARSGPGTQCSIGRVSPSGGIKEFAIPRGNCSVFDLTLGHDGNIWFAVGQASGGAVGRITPGGSIQLFNLPSASSYVGEMWQAPNGALGFNVVTRTNNSQITVAMATVDQNGKISTVQIHQPGFSADQFTVGSDKNIWCVDPSRRAIDQITTDGVVHEFTIPTPGEVPIALLAAKDGNLWFAESKEKVGRITPAGRIAEYTITSPGAFISDLIVGPDGNLWFWEYFAPPGDNYLNTVGDIGRVTV